MSNLVVTGKGEKDFFSRVVDFGIEHDHFTNYRLEQMAKEMAEFNVDFCRFLGVNHVNTGEALKATERAFTLLSIALEESSAGDLKVATQLLSDTSPAILVKDILRSFKDIYTFFETLKRDGVELYEITTGTPYVKYIELVYADFGPADHFFGLTEGKLDAVRNVNDWRELKKVIKELDHQLALNKKYLPWDLLKKEFGLRQVREVYEHRHTFDWRMVASTVCVSFLFKGRNWAKPFVYWNSLRPCVDKVKTKSFKEFALVSAKKYLRAKFRKITADEVAFLLEEWEEALDHFQLFAPNKKECKQKEAWAGILVVSSSKTVGKKKVATPVESIIIDVLEEDPRLFTGTRLEKLKKIDWSQTRRRLHQNVAEELDKARGMAAYLEPWKIIDQLPIDNIDMVCVLVETWDVWSQAAISKFIRRLVKEMPIRVWETLPMDTLKRIWSVAPAKEEGFLAGIVLEREEKEEK